MDTVDAALGAEPAPVDASSLADATPVALDAKSEARDTRVLEAMGRLRIGLDGLADGTRAAACGDVSGMQDPAAVIAAWMLTDDGADTKTRAASAKGLLDEYRDWRLLFAPTHPRPRAAPAPRPLHLR